jgi:hypothetical protein
MKKNQCIKLVTLAVVFLGTFYECSSDAQEDTPDDDIITTLYDTNVILSMFD